MDRLEEEGQEKAELSDGEKDKEADMPHVNARSLVSSLAMRSIADTRAKRAFQFREALSDVWLYMLLSWNRLWSFMVRNPSSFIMRRHFAC